jgi:hypothetical protein
MSTVNRQCSSWCRSRKVGAWPIPTGTVTARPWEEADLVWEIIDIGLGRMTVALRYVAMKGSGGMEKLVGAVGEASRMTDGVRNGCGEDSPMLQTPFI